MLQDFSDSFKAYLYDRTTSPLFGAFAASWSVWNYELILTIFSDWSVDKKIDFIDTVLFPDNVAESTLYNFFMHSLDLFIYPFFWAVFILLIYPFPSKWVYVRWKNHQIKMHDKRLELEKSQLVSNDEYEKLREEFFSLKSKLQSEIRARDEEIEYLQKKNYSLSTFEIKDAEPEEKVEKIREEQELTEEYEAQKTYVFPDKIAEEIFSMLTLSNNFISLDQLLSKLGNSRGLTEVQLLYYLEKLAKDKLISLSNNNSAKLTEYGRRVAVEQNMIIPF